MLKSQSFIKKGKKFIQEDLEESKKIASIRDLFLAFLGRDYHLSSARDLFDWEVSWIISQDLSLYDLLDRLGNILDFLNGDQEDVNWEEEETSHVIALVEESAGDLPLKELSSLMQFFIDKKWF